MKLLASLIITIFFTIKAFTQPKIVIETTKCPAKFYQGVFAKKYDTLGIQDIANNKNAYAKIVQSLNYNSIVKRLDKSYTITHWPFAIQEDLQLKDTIIVIANQFNTFTYYKLEGAANDKIGILNARITQPNFTIAGFECKQSKAKVLHIMGKQHQKVDGGNAILVADASLSYCAMLVFKKNTLAEILYESYLD